jgi:hypothetical protein
MQVTGPSTAPGSESPTGQISVSDGTQSCQATLSGSNGIATGSCALTEQTAGSYWLTASYQGDGIFDASTTSASTLLTVGKATSTTALKFSSTRVTYGNEGGETLSVAVSAEFAGSTPTGTVALRANDSTTLCTITLSGGTGSCSLSARSLPVGADEVVASYSGGTDFRPSPSPEVSLIVSKETSRVALKLSVSKVTYGHENSEHLSVSVSPEFAGSMPSGKVTAKVTSRTLCVILLSSGGKGSCNLSPKKLSSGAYGLVASYSGSSDFDTSASAKETLKVMK